MYLENRLLILVILLGSLLSAGTITVGEDISLALNNTATLTATGQCNNNQNTAHFEWTIQEKIGDGIFSTHSIFWFSPDESWTASQYHIKATIICPNETDKSDELIVTISSNPIEPPVNSNEIEIVQTSIGSNTFQFKALGDCQNNHLSAFEWTINERSSDGIFSTNRVFWFTPNNIEKTYHIRVKMICPNETDKMTTILLERNENNNPITLTRKKALTPENCQGEIVESGIDLNHNGFLDTNEITSIQEHYTEGTPITATELYAKVRNNEDVTSVNTCKITNMGSLFREQTSFNQDIGSWNTGSVTNMNWMFFRADTFNQDISRWDVSKVQQMRYMFADAKRFNQPLDSWDISNVEDVRWMFFRAYAFNKTLNSWDTSNITDMRLMFANATSFNQDISRWDTSKVPDMSAMFAHATSFNQPLNAWDTSNVQSMGNMFLSASSFNQALDMWDVSKVKKMNGIFKNATAFNQNLGVWDVSGIEIYSPQDVDGLVHSFKDTNISTENYDALLIGWSQKNLQENITMHVSAKYSTQAIQAREKLINDLNWTVIDEGQI